mmetsp:Transcript_7824/g.25802  ORF Transcript_7824/g.25802 Transcript_7824/m.25802 type:complete len:267 (-) Transcript_7824:193-993(-)
MVRLGSLLLDACNLQLGFELAATAPPRPIVTSPLVDDLPEKLASLSRLVLPSLGAGGLEAAATTTAVFDGAAFHSAFEGGRWDDTAEGFARVHFTDVHEKADDRLMRMIDDLAAADDEASPASPLRHGAEAAELLEACGEGACPVIVATRQRAVPGKAERQRREAFLKACGLPRLGDTAHLPSFTPAQRERSANLARGLHKLGPGVISFRLLERPNAILATDDRGLRRRAMANSPVVVLGRSQLFNWLEATTGEKGGEGWENTDGV